MFARRRKKIDVNSKMRSSIAPLLTDNAYLNAAFGSFEISSREESSAFIDCVLAPYVLLGGAYCHHVGGVHGNLGDEGYVIGRFGGRAYIESSPFDELGENVTGDVEKLSWGPTTGVAMGGKFVGGAIVFSVGEDCLSGPMSVLCERVG